MVQQKKVEAVEKLAGQIKASAASVFVDFRGLTVEEANNLRAACRKADVQYCVVKNRLAKRAFSDAGTLPPDEVLTGPTAIAFTDVEATAPARALSGFIKDCEHLQIKGGFLGSDWLDIDGVKQLSSIPSREELLGRMLGSLNSPLTKLAGVLSQLGGQRLATVLKAVADQKPN